MQPPVEIRYAGVIVGRAQEVRTMEGDQDSFFLFIREPLPVGSMLQLRSGDKETPARVVQSIEAIDAEKSGIQIKFITAEEAEKGLVPPPFNLEKFLAEAPPIKAPVAAPVKTTVSGTYYTVSTKAPSSDAIPVISPKANQSESIPISQAKAKDSGPAPAAPLKAKDSGPAPAAPLKAKDSGPAPAAPLKAKDSGPAPAAPLKAKDSGPAPAAPLKAASSEAVPSAPSKATDSEAIPVPIAKSMSEAIESAAQVAAKKPVGRTTLLMGSTSDAVPVTVGHSVTDALYNATQVPEPKPVKGTAPQGTPIKEKVEKESGVLETTDGPDSASQTSPVVAKPIQGPHKRGRSKKRK